MYRKYYSYSDMPHLVPKKEIESCDDKIAQPESCEKSKILGRFETDDVLLVIIILALLLEDGTDDTLLIALAVIFLSGIL